MEFLVAGQISLPNSERYKDTYKNRSNGGRIWRCQLCWECNWANEITIHTLAQVLTLLLVIVTFKPYAINYKYILSLFLYSYQKKSWVSVLEGGLAINSMICIQTYFTWSISIRQEGKNIQKIVLKTWREDINF